MIAVVLIYCAACLVFGVYGLVKFWGFEPIFIAGTDLEEVDHEDR